MNYVSTIFFDSEVVKEARYSEGHLTIFFINGSIYDYAAPQEVYDTMSGLLEGVGTFYHKAIKGKYQSIKIQ